MGWERQTTIIRSSLFESWGSVDLTPDNAGWGGCIRDWEGGAHRDIIQPTLAEAERVAEKVMGELRLAWDTNNQRHAREG